MWLTNDAESAGSGTLKFVSPSPETEMKKLAAGVAIITYETKRGEKSAFTNLGSH